MKGLKAAPVRPSGRGGADRLRDGCIAWRGRRPRKTMNLIMTVVMPRHHPTSCCRNPNCALQRQNPYAIVGFKSLFPDDLQKLPLRVEKLNG